MDLKNLLDGAKDFIDKDHDGLELSDFTSLLSGKGQSDDKNALTGDFFSKFTKFGSIGDLLAKVGVNNEDELASVDKDKLDKVVDKNSDFGSIQELMAAAKSFMAKKG